MPGVQAQHHVDRFGRRRQRGEPFELFAVVDHVERDAPVDDRAQLLVGLAAAVEVHPPGGEAAALSGQQLAQRADVQPQRRRREVLGEGGAQERLAGVADGDPARRAGAQEAIDLEVELVEVDDEQRRPVGCGEFAGGDAAERAVDGEWCGRHRR